MSAPYLLAIESAGQEASAALLRGEELVAEIACPPGAGVAETLLPRVHELLSGAGLGLDAIAAYAVSVGPGSFTGLRIGIATVKGLAFGSACPVVPVPTLAALARSAGRTGATAVALLDARRGELFAGAWERGGERAHASVPEGIYRPQELAPHLPEGALLVGEGIALLEAAGVGGNFGRVAPPGGRLAARHVGALGVRLLARGGGMAAADLVPRYGRRAAAEARRTGLR